MTTAGPADETRMPPLHTWKVWADQDCLFEGDEDKAKQFLLENIAHEPGLSLESPDGEFYSYQGARWVPLIL